MNFLEMYQNLNENYIDLLAVVSASGITSEDTIPYLDHVIRDESEKYYTSKRKAPYNIEDAFYWVRHAKS